MTAVEQSVDLCASQKYEEALLTLGEFRGAIVFRQMKFCNQSGMVGANGKRKSAVIRPYALSSA